MQQIMAHYWLYQCTCYISRAKCLNQLRVQPSSKPLIYIRRDAARPSG